jgi:glycosyltransferase involved in cell wall biosynthesis
MTERQQESLPTVSVVIPTRDRAELLERCLSAVLADEATTEAVVVVDGNDPETPAMLNRLARRDQRVQITSTPAGPAELSRVQRARDHGATLANSAVVLAMDDDVVAHPGLVSGHARWHAEREDAVVVGYMAVATARHWPRSYAPVRLYAGAYESTCKRYAAEPGLILRELWGGNVSVRRSHWLKAIQRPRVAEPYFDDKELGLLLLRDGRDAIFDPDLRADHCYERSLRSLVELAQEVPIGQARLRAAYPDLMGEESAPDQRRARAVVLRLAGSSAGWLVAKWGLIALTSVAAALHITSIEYRSAQVLWRIATERAARAIS